MDSEIVAKLKECHTPEAVAAFVTEIWNEGKHYQRALEYFSHTHISPPDHAKDLAQRALNGEAIWEL